MKVKVMQVGPIGTNCYILEDETTGKAAVIDPGDEAERILAALKEGGAEVTHCSPTATMTTPPLSRSWRRHCPRRPSISTGATPMVRATPCFPWRDRWPV